MFEEFDDQCLNLFCKEADTRLDVFVDVVDVVDVEQEE